MSIEFADLAAHGHGRRVFQFDKVASLPSPSPSSSSSAFPARWSPRSTRSRGETYEDLIRRAAADPLGRLVKLADHTTNSGPARLALLDDATAERLRQKYARAREMLDAEPHLG
ncbi:hypothetical protein [Phytohabitans kaempferiae]|uniref:Uncharacterized protein n=1 Tax=Phytohabitans kaempferiae TaxID=1620943 RepID=A0ABV6MCN2_9ACTN